jgi:WD40 repeat protein
MWPSILTIAIVCFAQQLDEGALGKLPVDDPALVLTGHEYGSICNVSFSPDSTRLASAGDDTIIRIWDSQSGREIAAIRGHSARINSIAFSGDGKQVLAGGHKSGDPLDSELMLWDAETGRQIRKLAERDGPVTSVAFSPDGKRFASANMFTNNVLVQPVLKIWDASTVQEIVTLKTDAFCISFSADGKRLVTADAYHRIRTWDWANQESLLTLTGHEATRISKIGTVTFSPDDKHIVSGSAAGGLVIGDTLRGQIAIWDSSTGKQVAMITSPHGMVTAIAFSPDGKRFVSGGGVNDNLDLVVWNFETRQPLRKLHGAADYVRCIAFSPDGKRVAAGDDKKTVCLWDATKW